MMDFPWDKIPENMRYCRFCKGDLAQDSPGVELEVQYFPGTPKRIRHIAHAHCALKRYTQGIARSVPGGQSGGGL